MLAGLIGAAASGLKGAADAYSVGAKSEFDKNQKIDLSQELLNMEEQKALRVDEITRSRNIADVGRLATANAAAAPIVAGGVVAGQVATEQGIRDTGLPNLKAQNKVAGITAESTAGVPEAEAALKTKQLTANASNVDLQASQTAKANAKAEVEASSVTGYYAMLTKKKLASEGSDTKAAAALASFQLANAKGLEIIKKEIIDARGRDDEAGVLAAEQKLSTMTGGVKSYADVIKAAGILETMSRDILDPMKNGNMDEKSAQQQAATLRQSAIELIKSVSAKKGLAPKDGSTANPADFDSRNSKK